ncbi:tetratricopeptide (TPR) repeat protein [Actinomadura cellulosilytica]|uniref:Tetratricopeptide (TPR) repeat protein n=2 Tax=Thermomonospora cellulosilytica TaxID=1411118 RepID=A0A7W3MV77_9ACTN|nr:tetratricopeptide (TPR) repeat protein [Thermomonospora cellulosilytica]
MMTRRVGEALVAQDRPREAIGPLTEALAFFTGRGDHYNRARVLSGLARALVADGRAADARTALHDALDAAGAVGARREVAGIHESLADVARLLGDPAAERRHLEQAVALFQELGARRGEAVAARLAELRRRPDPQAPR